MGMSGNGKHDDESLVYYTMVYLPYYTGIPHCLILYHSLCLFGQTHAEELVIESLSKDVGPPEAVDLDGWTLETSQLQLVEETEEDIKEAWVERL